MSRHALVRLLKIEQVCDRFESTWQLGDTPRIEDYLREHSELASDLLSPLLTVEVDYRRQRGERPSWDDFRSRFPEAVALLTELLGPDLTVTAVLNQLATLHLVPSARLAMLEQQTTVSDAGRPGSVLLEQLVNDGVLTTFQAEQLTAGRGRSLKLENYVLLDKLGQGGMGTVWKARHHATGAIVALKVLDPKLTKHPAMVSRFQRESRVASLLKHPNIVATSGAGHADATHFLVMEYIEGQDLAARLQDQGTVSLSQAIDWVAQIARGLESAHRLGIIHRDIKLANLLLDHSGTIKILDLGLARFAGEGGHEDNLTGTGEFIGTVDFISPEQALSARNADTRSDVYSLGMVFWWLLVNRPAYDGRTIMARILAHREAPTPSLVAALADSAIGADPRLMAVDQIFQKMVAKEPADRYQSMTEALAALRAVSTSHR